MLKFNIGQKIYYRGDMANNPGWFEITEIIEDDYFRGYVLKEIDGEGRTFARVFDCMIHEIDKGHGGTRFVTEEAYRKHREEQLKKLQESIARRAKRCNECLECHHFSNGCDGNSKPCEAFEYETR